jgi:peroxiredoxin Q/BCP
MLKTGIDAPPFTLSDQSGKSVKLADLRGKWVALWWYPKASTPG